MRHRQVASVAPKKATYEVVKELDAFAKIPEGYKETTASGGGSKYSSSVVIYY